MDTTQPTTGTGSIDASASIRREFRSLRDALATAWRQLTQSSETESFLETFQRAQQSSHAIVQLAPDVDHALLQDLLAVELEWFETEARSVLSDPSLEPDQLADALALIRAQDRLLLRITRAVEGLPIWDETPFLLIELQEIENGFAVEQPSPPAARLVDIADREDPDDYEGLPDAIESSLRDLRLALFERQAERLLKRAQSIDADTETSVTQLNQLLEQLSDLRHELGWRQERRNIGELTPLVERLRDEEKRVRDRMLARAADADDPGDFRDLSESAVLITGALDRTRMNAYEKGGGRSVAELRQILDTGLQFHRIYQRKRRRYEPDETTPPADGAKRGVNGTTGSAIERRLRRMTRRVNDVIADRILSDRLHRLFGRRLVARWESLIFWLIMGVLGLIVVDHYRDHSVDGGVDWTIWIDTAICCVLLLDFSVRWMLSPQRIRFFARHALTDLLPALPYGLLANLDRISSISSVRLLRLVRVFRVLRLAQPIVRIVRLMLFVARAADRLVLRNAWLLNRNIIFFTDTQFDEDEPTQLKRARELNTWVTRATTDAFSGLTFEQRTRSAATRAALVEVELRRDTSRVEVVSIRDHGSDTHARDIDVEEVIENLRNLDSNQVAQIVGLEFAQQLTDSMRFFRIPFVRRLPAIRYVLGPTGVPDPLHTTARMGRVLGDGLETARRTINWFADLHGTITGPQFLDRVGMQLVKAAQRPAKRLILFGAIVGVLMFLIRLTNLPFLDSFAGVLLKFLSFPVLVLGGICLIPLSIGSWFRKIAGQAADFYDRVAEAQFLSLTETVKEQTQDADLTYLAERVLLPEANLNANGRVVPTDEICHALLDIFQKNVPDEAAPVRTFVRWSTCDFVLLFYRDFLDGSFFHRSDTKVANMLLGNVTLENVRLNRLRFDKKRLKKLDKIDIGRGKGGVAGAYVWFHSITHAVAQQTARLIIEYNQHCIPLDERSAAHPIDQRLFDDWLAARLAISARAREQVESWIAPPPSERLSGVDGTLAYRTTEFNALHFLLCEPERDASVERRYGPAVARLMVEDRENLIRMIFGTFPVQELPKERRTFNPFEFYRSYFARGRVFVFPFVALMFVGRGIRILFRRIVDIIRDLVDPDTRVITETRGRASFDVARRKIHRMRRPVVMEAVRLRADFDLQYLGLPLPGREPPDVTEHGLATDLRDLNASEREWEEFRNVKSRREGQARLLAKIFRIARRRGSDFEAEMRERNPRLVGREGEALRAAATAFVCDHEYVRSIVTSFEGLNAALDRLRALPRARPRFRTPTPRRRRVTQLVRRVWPILTATPQFPSDRSSTSKRKGAPAPETSRPSTVATATSTKPIHGTDTSEGDLLRDDILRVMFIESILAEGKEGEEPIKILLDKLGEGNDPYQFAYDRLLQVGEQPSSWSEQIIAVRTVQSLGMLDLRGYERMIATLGNYSLTSAQKRADDTLRLAPKL